MPIEFPCSECHSTLRVPEQHVGKRARCPKCRTLNMVQSDSGPLPQTGNTGGNAPLYQQPAEADTGQPPLGSPFAPPMPDAGSPFAYAPGSVLPPGGYILKQYSEPDRGTLILILGIMSLFFNFFWVPGILAWTFGRADLRKISEGTMDPAARGITQVGMVLGIIGTSIAILGILFFLGFIALVVIAAVAGAAGS